MTNSGVFSNKKGIKAAKEAAGSMQYAAAQGVEAAEAYKAQLMAAEMAKLQVFSALGAPGTYGPDAAAAAAASPAGSIYDTTSDLSKPDQGLRQSMPYASESAKEGLLGGVRMGILDPEAYASKIAQSSSFRTRSALTAEAEQLANREGELYDRLENSIIGVINEGAALALRDRMRDIRTQGARSGGTARNAGLQDARRINAMESSMRQRVQQTWEANRDFDTHIKEVIAKTQAGNTAFLEDLPGTNRAFLDAMGESAKMHIEAGKMAGAIYQGAYAVRQSQQPVNFWVGFAEALVSGMAGWALGEMADGGPAGLVKSAGEKLTAGADYAKGILGPDTGRDEQGNLLGPLVSPEGEDNRQYGDAGARISKLLGWDKG